ncbi:PREDICTED: wall-associated [Prunus dulcis]|uniref:PREDICTED: wall-associated n=1 Tax=Prunus dulcis TaxID=3755 RepID=A0A5E4G998_PRUDU|nr:PREDICTED: wall-associated [Prunus dulcis]
MQSQAVHMMILLLIFLVLLIIYACAAAAAQEFYYPNAKPFCKEKCGGVLIPYPFGIGHIEIECSNQSSKTTSFLKRAQLKVLSISIEGTLRVNSPVTFFCNGNGSSEMANLTGSPFVYSQDKNRFTAVSCGFLAMMESAEFVVGGCRSVCDHRRYNASCDIGINCCQTTIPPYLTMIGASILYQGHFLCSTDMPPRLRIPVALLVAGGLYGLLFLLIGVRWSHKVIKKRKDIKRKQKFLKQYGGLLLEKQLSSGEVNVEKIKVFSSKDLDKATDKFSIDRILGQGGQETEVPLLVYQFIPNGTLSQYIHHPNEEFCLTWEMHLRIAIEVAGALSYLHSAASFPIYHRDIKSSNILLDEKYRAKVADFGTSRSVSIDQTHLTTLVHGTFGYLDPEYFQSSQFTEKSDVYSFGVVLAELLTGQKPVSLMRSQESRSLATYFLLSMENNLLFDILDSQVMKGGRKENITAVANLAVRCLNLNGRNRPTMKEVAVELEGIQLSVRAEIDVQQVFPEVRCVQTQEINEVWDVVSSSTGPCTDGGTGSSFDVQPLLFFNTQ